MREMSGKVAVVTGAGGGLGRAVATALAREGMRVAVADLDGESLESIAQELRFAGASVSAYHTDVSKAEDMDALAARVFDEMGGASLVCNCAGVALMAPVWETTLADWQWTLGVNVWGVIHSMRAFVPRLIAQDSGHIVNLASIAGLISPPGSGAYSAGMHAVVSLSETLHHDLREIGSNVGVSVLCPAYVPTGSPESERKRPKQFANPPREMSPLQRAKQAMLRKAAQSGRISEEQVAQIMVAGIKANRFYILTHPRIKGTVEDRLQDILQERVPHNPLAT